jgi:hypothetical protein
MIAWLPLSFGNMPYRRLRLPSSSSSSIILPETGLVLGVAGRALACHSLAYGRLLFLKKCF